MKHLFAVFIATAVAKKLSNMGYAQAIRKKNGKYGVVADPYSTRAHATTARNNLRKTIFRGIYCGVA
ncbi:MAG: SPOR domain-containing protein [Alphaproteobacteria bacterium]